MINWSVDLGELADFIGRSEGFSETIETPIYLDDILRAGHGVATKRFDQDFAAAAAATQQFNHMFEWGTTGINPAPRTPKLSPTSKAAKLWLHRLGGGQSSVKTIDFEFRASMVPVPLPTPRTTGIAHSWFAGKRAPKRRHIFYWKAPISEYGMAVTIKPVYAQALWIPLKGRGSNNPRAEARGFAMTSQPVRAVPGKRFAGNFSSFWQAWWTSAGYNVITEAARRAVDSDAKKIIGASGRRKARRYSSTRTKGFSLQVSTARAEAKAALHGFSRSRAAVDGIEDAPIKDRWTR